MMIETIAKILTGVLIIEYAIFMLALVQLDRIVTKLNDIKRMLERKSDND